MQEARRRRLGHSSHSSRPRRSHHEDRIHVVHEPGAVPRPARLAPDRGRRPGLSVPARRPDLHGLFSPPGRAGALERHAVPRRDGAALQVAMERAQLPGSGRPPARASGRRRWGLWHLGRPRLRLEQRQRRGRAGTEEAHRARPVLEVCGPQRGDAGPDLPRRAAARGRPPGRQGDLPRYPQLPRGARRRQQAARRRTARVPAPRDGGCASPDHHLLGNPDASHRQALAALQARGQGVHGNRPRPQRALPHGRHPRERVPAAVTGHADVRNRLVRSRSQEYALVGKRENYGLLDWSPERVHVKLVDKRGPVSYTIDNDSFAYVEHEPAP